MSLSDRRQFLLALAALPVAGCGFAPVHGTIRGAGGGSAADRLFGQVDVAPVDSREGFALVGRLEERLGRAGGAASYALSVTLETRMEEVALSTTNEIDRFNVLGIARFQLRRAGGGELLVTGAVDNFTSFNSTVGTVASMAAERDAKERLARALADQIVTRLMASAPAWPEE
ncbi:MAG: hypothetical protein CVT80_07900 [Alphaproteobacteria bacterium HGW-Alphaproteobacteria-2]|nr:MAG: hypothetical protein CVT80_07900 [Alphaproteobacteria bacterium HGW-Alphaproteobacteria-2]